MKVLVTGATGFIGSHIVRALLSRDYEVRVLVRPGADDRNIRGLRVEVCPGDICDRGSLLRAVEGCRGIFHCAALYSFWCPDPAVIYRTNVEGTVNVMEAALQAGVGRVVYTSSACTVGLPEEGPGREELFPSEREVIGHYKRSKYLAELRVIEMCRRGLPAVIVNPTTPIGSHDIKPTPTGKIVLDFLRRRMPAYIDTGLNLIDVEDVALGHVLAWERGRVGERYILGHRNLYFREILRMLSDLTGIRPPRIRLPRWLPLALSYLDGFIEGRLLRRPPFLQTEAIKMAWRPMFYDASKAFRELGLPRSPVEGALEKAVRWFRENGYV